MHTKIAHEDGQKALLTWLVASASMLRPRRTGAVWPRTRRWWLVRLVKRAGLNSMIILPAESLHNPHGPSGQP